MVVSASLRDRATPAELAAVVERDGSSGLGVELGTDGASLDFERVYAENFDFIWRAVRGLGVPVATADDVTQDVFMIVHRKLAEVQTKSALRSWLFGVTRRVCKDYRRALGRRGVHLELEGQHEANVAEDPQEKIQARQALQAVERFANELEEERRALFFLALIEGLNINDVAETLGWNANTTYSRVRVLRQQLAERLGLESKETRGHHGRA